MKEQIRRRTILAFDEINPLISTSYQTNSAVTEDLLSLLVKAYRLGVRNVRDMLEIDMEEDMDLMYEAIFRDIEGKTFEDRAISHVRDKDLKGLLSLAESEFHRVYNVGAQDTAEYAQGTTWRTVIKTWNTMLDEKVRETHQYLEGVSVPVNDEFFAYDGDHALYPGGFRMAKNNVNCRCILSYRYSGR